MCVGFAASIVLFLSVFVIDLDFSVHFGSVSIGGRPISIVAVFVGSFLGGAMGFASSFITHPLFTLLLERFSGLPLARK